MNLLAEQLQKSPLVARVAPFVVFVALTFLQNQFGESARYWLYLAKTLVGAWMLWVVRPLITEMRWNLTWSAVLTGVAVFGLWVGLDRVIPNQQELWAKLGFSSGSKSTVSQWNPLDHFGGNGVLAWFFIVVRIVGSSLIVPPLEEVFYRSFLYRWIAKPDFESVPLGQFSWRPFLITATVFGLAHNEWLAGILCAAAYQCLVFWKNRLGDAMTAHGITNLLLGVWVVLRSEWHFW